MSVETGTDKNFKEIITTNPKVVVKFYADWCGACRLIAPKFKKMSEEEGLSDIVFVEVDAEANNEVRKLAGVTNLPFFATFDNGSLVEGAATGKEEYLRVMLAAL